MVILKVRKFIALIAGVLLTACTQVQLSSTMGQIPGAHYKVSKVISKLQEYQESIESMAEIVACDGDYAQALAQLKTRNEQLLTTALADQEIGVKHWENGDKATEDHFRAYLNHQVDTYQWFNANKRSLLETAKICDTAHVRGAEQTINFY